MPSSGILCIWVVDIELEHIVLHNPDCVVFTSQPSHGLLSFSNPIYGRQS